MILRDRDENKYQEILQYLNLENRLKDYQTSPKQSILSIPIISNVENPTTNKKKKVCNFILYLDSEDATFFDSGKVFDILLLFINGLVKSLHSLDEKKQIQFKSHEDLFEAMEAIDAGSFSKIGKEDFFGDSFIEYTDFKKGFESKDLILQKFYCLT